MVLQMNEFLRVLDDNTSTVAILVCGDMTDAICMGDLRLREFNEALVAILKERDFDNVLFYDGSDAMGRFVLDDDSAFWSIDSAKASYMKKYSEAPTYAALYPRKRLSAISPVKDGMSYFGGAPGSGSGSGSGCNSKYRSLFGPIPKVAKRDPQEFYFLLEGLSDSGMRNFVTESRMEPAKSDADGGDDEELREMRSLRFLGALKGDPAEWIEVPHHVAMDGRDSFYPKCDKLMRHELLRSAIVVTNILDLAKRDGEMSKYVSSIHHQWRGRSLLVFLHPDLGSGDNDDFYWLLKKAGIFEYFYQNGKNGVEPRRGRVFRITHYGKDEIVNLFRRHGLNGQTGGEGELDDLADKLLYMARAINADPDLRSISLRDLDKRLADATADLGKKAKIDENWLARLVDADIRDFDFDPWGTLRRTRGWEGVVSDLEELLRGHGEGGKRGGASIELGEIDSHGREADGSDDWLGECFVERFGGQGPRERPTSSKLPHLMLEGGPGTGKTTLARALGRIMHDEGLLAVGHVVLARRADLISDVIGGTAIKVEKMLDKAENGVLFIDEAYDLCKDVDLKRSNAGTFAQEAVNTLVNAMTDDERHVLIIFAGYKSSAPGALDGVRGLFKMNPGLESRIRKILTIPDYDPEILTQIFFDVLEKKGYSLGEDLSRDDILNYMRNIYQTRNRKTFGNAREIKEGLIEAKLIPAARRRGGTEILRKDFGEEAAKLKEATLDSIFEEMRSYPGLGEIGEKIIRSYMAHREMLLEDGEPGGSIANMRHLVFVGSPGTGKTTIAKLLARAMGAANLMSGAPPIVIGNVWNITPDELETKIKDAVDNNTFLLIDEAHNAPNHVIQGLLNPMSENKGLTCIFAVYGDRLDEFMAKDRGLKRRCESHFIEDYDKDALLAIFKSMMAKRKRKADEECLRTLHALFGVWYEGRKKSGDFGNAGSVERLLEKMMENAYQDGKRKSLQVKDIPDGEMAKLRLAGKLE